MIVFAPGLLSTTTCWPSLSLNAAPTRRASASDPPPGGQPTMSLMGLDGYVCPQAAVAPSTAVNESSMTGMRPLTRRTDDMRSPLRLLNLPSVFCDYIKEAHDFRVLHFVFRCAGARTGEVSHWTPRTDGDIAHIRNIGCRLLCFHLRIQ